MGFRKTSATLFGLTLLVGACTGNGPISESDRMDAATEQLNKQRIADAEAAVQESRNRVAIQEMLKRLAALEIALTEEADLRKKGDAALLQRVTSLETSVTQFKANVEATIAEMSGAIAANSLKSAEIEQKINAEKIRIRQEMAAAIASSSASMAERYTAENLRIEAELRILDRKLQAAEEYAKSTFATKEALLNMQVVASELENSIRLVDRRLDMTDAALREKIDATTTQIMDAVSSAIERLDASDADLASKLEAAIDLSNSRLDELARSAAGKMDDLNIAITRMQLTSVANFAAIQDQFGSLQQDLASMSALNASFRESVDNKFTELENADTALKVSFQTALATGLAMEQAERKKITDALEAMNAKIRDAAQEAAVANQIARQAKDLGEANQARLAELSAKVDVVESSLRSAIDGVAQRASDLFASLDQKYQAAIAGISARLAESENRLAQLTRSLSTILVDPFKVPAEALSAFESEARTKREALIAASSEFGEGLGIFNAYILDAMNILNENAPPNPALSQSFMQKVVDSGLCPGSGREPGQQPQAGGFQWYRHLAAAYMRAVFFGDRSVTPVEDRGIYLDIPRMELNSLASIIVYSLIPAFDSTRSANACQARIDDWAADALFGAGEMTQASAALRAKLRDASLMRSFVASILMPRLSNLKAAANTYESLLVALLSRYIVPFDRNLVMFGIGQNPDAAVLQRIAGILRDIVEMKRDISTLETEFSNMKGMLQSLSAAQGKTNAEVRTLGEAMASLRADISAINAEQDKKINALALSLQKTLALVSVLASRSGHADISMAAKFLSGSLSNKFGGGTGEVVPGGLLSAMFMFPYVPTDAERQKIALCDGPALTPESTSTPSVSSSCAGLLRFGTRTVKEAVPPASVIINRNGRLWFTYPSYSQQCVQNVQAYARYTTQLAESICRKASTGSAASTTFEPSNHASIQGGQLLVEAQPPFSEKAISRLDASDASDPVPADKLVEPRFRLAVGSDAAFIRFWSGVADEPFFLVDLAAFKSEVINKIRYVDLPASFVFSKTANGFFTTVHMTALSASLEEKGTIKYSLNGGGMVTSEEKIIAAYSGGNINLYTYSPLVLELSGSDKPATTSWLERDVRFDLDANGRKERTGWTGGDSLLLALDVNKNGAIDDGRELFGTATLLPDGRRAENGYIALAQHDGNGDGVIDARDKVFRKLRLWRDRNSNGVSDPGELQSLASTGVTKIGIAHEFVANGKSDTHHGQLATNRVYYQGRFEGPASCPREGCHSFDVWFGAIPESAKTASK